MKPNTVIAPSTVDRPATAEEIRAAIVPSSEPIDEYADGVVHEIAADLGGYVRITALDFEASLMIEELTKDQGKWTN